MGTPFWPAGLHAWLTNAPCSWRDYFIFVSKKYGSSLYTLEGIEGDMDSKVAHERKQQWLSPGSFSDGSDGFVRWALYKTGVPLIDANMKELAMTG